MHTRLSFWAAEQAARLPKGFFDVLGRCGLAARRGCPGRAASNQAPTVDDACSWGCGWFDSSHELVHGLQIEEDSAEVLNALPLATWMDLQWRSSSPVMPSA